MTDAEFQSYLNKMAEHLSTNKQFVENPVRAREIANAFVLAKSLFPDAKIELKDDPLKMGAVIMRIEDYDIDVCGEASIRRFSAMLNKANDVEIYATEDGNARISILFNNVFVVSK